MHMIAENGIAAHWSYKEKGSHAPAEDSRVAWLRALLDNSEGTSPREFLDSLKVDLYPDDVYSFTPRGDVFSFPRGATILDFAYRIHTQVGQTCVGGRINGRWVPLKTEIKNGDIVEITTSNRQRPHHDWLSIVATNRARSKIRAWLKREEKQRAVEVGHKLLDRELRRIGTSLRKVSGSEELAKIIQANGMSKEDDLLAAVGFGRMPVTSVTGRLQGGRAGRGWGGGSGHQTARSQGWLEAVLSRSPATRTFWSMWLNAANLCREKRSSVSSPGARAWRCTHGRARMSATSCITRSARSKCGGRQAKRARKRRLLRSMWTWPLPTVRGCSHPFAGDLVGGERHSQLSFAHRTRRNRFRRHDDRRPGCGTAQPHPAPAAGPERNVTGGKTWAGGSRPMTIAGIRSRSEGLS